MKTLRLYSNGLGLAQARRARFGFTIVEITVVLAILLTLIGISISSMNGYRDWQKGSEAATSLREVYTAQRTYLAEHPTEVPADLTADKIKPYLSGKKKLPTAKDLNDKDLFLNFKKSPPVWSETKDGPAYDPSGKSDDGLWDVGG